MHEKAVYMHK